MIFNFVKIFFLPSVVIFLTSLYAAYPSFNLALFGDDWQQIYGYFHYLGSESSIAQHLTFFTGGYGAFEILTGLLYSVFGQNYQIYYQFAYMYKLIAAFSIWPLTFYLTHSKLAAFYASLFLSVTVVGLESTNWVINSPAYLAVANLSIFLFFFIKSRENLKLKYFIAAVLFFYLAHIFAPIRMTGLLPFTVFLELFLYLKSSGIKSAKLSFMRIITIFIIFVIISVTGASAHRTGTLIGEASRTIHSGFSQISAALEKGRSDFLFIPIMTVGRMVIPNTVTVKTPALILAMFLFIGFLLPNIPKGKKVGQLVVGGIIFWTLITLLIYNLNKSTLLVPDAFSLAIGGYVLILGIILLFSFFRQSISNGFFIGVFWTIFSFIFPWIRAPETLHPTEHRYLVASMVGIGVLFASVIGLGKEQRNRINLFLLLIIFIILNIVTTRGFFIDVVENSHGKEAMNKIWSAFPTIAEIGKTDRPLMFYFGSVPEKQRLKHHSLTFGFPYRMAIRYGIYDEDVSISLARMPISVNEGKDLVSALTDGESLLINGHTKETIPIENIYAFYLDENNNLINITTEVRDKLKEELNKKN